MWPFTKKYKPSKPSEPKFKAGDKVVFKPLNPYYFINPAEYFFRSETIYEIFKVERKSNTVWYYHLLWEGSVGKNYGTYAWETDLEFPWEKSVEFN